MADLGDLDKRIDKAVENYCRPGALKRFLFDQGKPVIYLSDDGTVIVTEHPDGTIKREPCGEFGFSEPVSPQSRSADQENST